MGFLQEVQYGSEYLAARITGYNCAGQPVIIAR